MTAPKKPARRPVRAKTPAVLDKPGLDLTPAEMSLLMAYRTMDDIARRHMHLLCESIAKARPRHAAPKFRLIVGGVS